MNICLLDESGDGRLAQLAQRFGLLHDASQPLALAQTTERLELRRQWRTAPHQPKQGAVSVDFVAGALAWRGKFGGGRGEALVRAVGVKGGYLPVVLDATAGFGRDAFVLAAAGCRVHMLERNPVVAALLEDGLQRGWQHPQAGGWLRERLSLHYGAIQDGFLPRDFSRHEFSQRADVTQHPSVHYPSVHYPSAHHPSAHHSPALDHQSADHHHFVPDSQGAPDHQSALYEAAPYRAVMQHSGSESALMAFGEAIQVVYLDPMFPHRQKSAQVRQDMQLLQMLVGADNDADRLLTPARLLAQKRVVVKRPAYAPPLANLPPQGAVRTKKHRFDIYMPLAACQ